MQAGELYDARLEMPGWNRAGFDASEWCGRFRIEIQPLLQAYRAIGALAADAEVSEPKAGEYVFTSGQNFPVGSA